MFECIISNLLSLCSMKGGAKVVIEPHRHPGVFIARGREDALCTLNMNPGKQVYGEKLIKVDVSPAWGRSHCFSSLPSNSCCPSCRAPTARSSSTVSGTPSALSLLLQCLEALNLFTWAPVLKCFTLALPAAQVYHMYQTSLAQ